MKNRINIKQNGVAILKDDVKLKELFEREATRDNKLFTFILKKYDKISYEKIAFGFEFSKAGKKNRYYCAFGNSEDYLDFSKRFIFKEKDFLEIFEIQEIFD